MPTICYLNDDLAVDVLLGHSAQSEGSTSYAIADASRARQADYFSGDVLRLEH